MIDPKTLIDPDLAFFAEVPRAEIDLAPAGLAGTRALLLQLFQAPDVAESSANVIVREVHVPGFTGEAVRCLMYSPASLAAHPRPVIVEIHGGGFVLGRPEQNDRINRSACEAHHCVVIAVDYRLAPEAPPLGGVEDCYAVLQWLFAEAATLRIDPARIAIRGDSGGGGVAAALALLARDRGGPPIILQLLIYPMLDDRTGSTVDRGPYAGFVGWSPELNRAGWRALLGREPGGEDVSHHQSPARAGTLAGLPPTFIAVGALDLFLEEDLEYARRLARGGVPIELHVYPGAPHGFDRFDDVEVASQIKRDIDHALRRAFDVK